MSSFDMLIDTTGSHMSLLPEVREMTPVVNGNQFRKFQMNAGFYLTSRNLISGYVTAFWRWGK